MENVVIVSAKRTPIGKLGGSLSKLKATELGRHAIDGLFKDVEVDRRDVDLVIMGNVLQAGLGQNPARQAAISANIPLHVPAFTVNEVCGSGMKAIHLGMQSIMLGESKVVVVGGFENMSQAPYLLKNARFGAKYNNLEAIDSMYHDGLMDIYSEKAMGLTAENVAKKHEISRLEQDEYAYRSQKLATQATKEGKFKKEIVSIGTLAQDESIREDTTMEKLSSLRPAFDKEGTITAGNASTINDGAAALLLMSESEALAKGVDILAYLDGYVEIGNDPDYMGYAPYYAIRSLYEKMEVSDEEIDFYEINEAFASQTLAVIKDLKLDINKVNRLGGAIALGHPIGASGARIVVSLVHQLKSQEKAIASLCIGGGMGSALLVSKGEQN